MTTTTPPSETVWPYDILKFAKKPPAKAYSQAKKNEALRYARVAQDAMAIQTVLASGYAPASDWFVKTLDGV